MVCLSIVIPVLGNSNLLDDTLVSVLENRPANCEILVVHTQPYDDPYGLAGEVRFVKASAKARLVECLNLGISASQAPVVHVLACGVEVCSGWADAAMARFRDPRVAAVAAVVQRADRPEKIASAGLRYGVEGVIHRLVAIDRESETPCSPDPLAAFYRKSIVDALGGLHRWSSDALAAIDLAMAMREAGYRCVLESGCAAKAKSAATRDRSGFRHGRDIEWLFRRWASRHGAFRSAVAHTAMLAGECTMTLWRPQLVLRLLGRLWAAVRSLPAEHRLRPRLSAGAETPSVISSPHFAATCDDATSSARAA